MILWIKEYLATIIICLVLALIVAAVIVHMVRQKKQGKSSCGCGCENCAMNESCHKNK